MRKGAKSPVEETFAALMLFVGRGDEIDMRRTLATYPLRMTTVHDYASRALAG